MALKYVEVRVAMDKMLKVKLSLDSLLVENFEKSFKTRGIKTVVWLGSTQWPSQTEKQLYRGEHLNNRTMATQFDTSIASLLPGPASEMVNRNRPKEHSSMMDDVDTISAVAQAKL